MIMKISIDTVVSFIMVISSTSFRIYAKQSRWNIQWYKCYDDVKKYDRDNNNPYKNSFRKKYIYLWDLKICCWFPFFLKTWHRLINFIYSCRCKLKFSIRALPGKIFNREASLIWFICDNIFWMSMAMKEAQWIIKL